MWGLPEEEELEWEPKRTSFHSHRNDYFVRDSVNPLLQNASPASMPASIIVNVQNPL